MISMWMAWYNISDGHTTVSEYRIDHFAPEWREVGSEVQGYGPYEQMADLMLGLKFFVVLWFFVAFVFVLQATAKEVSLTSVLVVGASLISLGIIALAYFASVFPGACPSPLVSAFFSSTSVGNVTYTGGPGDGFYVFAFACLIQAFAVSLDFVGVYSEKHLSEPEP
jgi:fucose 4-O-acetylase-like acetyltransferase